MLQLKKGKCFPIKKDARTRLQHFRGGIILAGGIRKALESRCHVSFRCLKIGKRLHEDFWEAGMGEGKEKGFQEVSIRKYSVRGKHQMSTDPLESLVVINKT